MKTAILACSILLLAWTSGMAQAETETPAASPESGLRVERVLWKPAEPTGGELEVQYRLINVDELPKHPSITYVLDPATGEKVQLRRVAMMPPTAVDPAKAPLAKFVLQDEQGLIRPGQRVTVVVAGLVQADVLVEGPGVHEGVLKAGAAGGEGSTERFDTVPEDATLEVVKLRVSGGGFLLDLRYRVSGEGMVLSDERTTYLEKRDTGEKLYVLGVARIGTLATKDAGPSKTSFLLIQNPHRTIKTGDRVDVVVAGIRSNDILVE
jgi:hypothetical protein